MSAPVRINITTIPGKILLWCFSFRTELFLALSLLFFLICKSNSAINKKITNYSLQYLVIPSSQIISLPLNLYSFLTEGVNEILNLKHHNAKLREQNIALKKMVLDYKKYASQTEILRQALNLKEKHSYKTKASRIFINNIGSYHQTSVVNVGTIDNISKNQIVISEDGLVGRILSANQNNSQILLFTDLQSKIPVYSSESREKAIMFGDNNNLSKLEYLQNDHSLKPGEIIYSSGDGEIFPADIPIGIAVKDAQDQFVVKPFVDLYRLEFVLIINTDYENEATTL